MARALRIPPLLLLLATAPFAQLDLPAKPSKPRPDEPVHELPPQHRGDLPGGRRDELDLPKTAPPPADTAPIPQGPGAPASLPAPLQPGDEAIALLASLEKVRTLDESGYVSAQARLGQLGPEAVPAAQRGIESDALGVLVASARVLLAHGTPEDRARVAERLRRPLPASAAGPMLEALVARDPVVASPALLAELLDHPTAAVRQAAQRVLQDRVDPALLPFLAGRFASQRSDTRLRALELVARIGGPDALPLVASRLGDPVPRVAAEAVRFFALEEGPETSEFLRERAFADGVADRSAAHALLALVEREDKSGRVELTLDDAPALLTALRAGEPIVSGAAAAALAGIGFRNPASPATAWLDLEVPHTLVRLGSGAEFHRDFSTLQPIALRRLALISGEPLGSDGLAWRSWWTDSARGFRARRAVLAIEPGAQDTLFAELRRGGSVTVLAGPAAERIEEPGVLVVTPQECVRLLELLRAEGVLGLERLPTARATRDDDAGRLGLAVGAGVQEKRFDFPGGTAPAWAERVATELETLADRHVWQHFRDRSRFSTQREFVAAEEPWWNETHTEAERARRLADLVLAALVQAAPGQRQAGLNELRRLFALPSTAAAADVEPLTACLAREEAYGERVEQLVELIVIAAEQGTDGRLSPEQSSALVASCARFGEAGLEALGSVLRASGAEAVLAASRDPAPLVRRAAVRAVAREPSPEATALLIALLDDPDESVCATAIESLGEHPAPESRSLLLARASTAPPSLRPSVLRAIGRAGGEGARDVLVLALAEEDPAVQLAAVEGLAELADPGTASLLVSILSRGAGEEWTEQARRGLARIGSPAWPQLLRVANSPKSRGQREAALLLARQGVPDAAPILITLLTLDPADASAAEELAVLSCVDHRQASDPARAWWDWWDLVVHDDALAWFRAGLEREGLRAPEAVELAGGSEEAALFLVGVATGEHSRPLAGRARRELERILDQELAPLPADAATRAQLAGELERLVRSRFDGSTSR